jgi:hypothetical protein
MKTKVIFRKWPGSQHVIALFPRVPHDVLGRYCESYMQVGQHGGADPGLVNNTVPATPAEYGPLKAELEGLGYELDIARRITELDHRHRLAALQTGKVETVDTMDKLPIPEPGSGGIYLPNWQVWVSYRATAWGYLNRGDGGLFVTYKGTTYSKATA